MSIFPAVGVIVGAPAALHLTPVNVAVPLPVDAACFKSRTKDLPAVDVGMVNVQAVDAVSVAVSTVPLVSDNVFEVVTVPIATTVSMYPVIVGLVKAGVVNDPVVTVGFVIVTVVSVLFATVCVSFRVTIPAPVRVIAPVPPLATGNGVPEYEMAMVPLVVTGEFDTDKNDGTDTPTLDTDADAFAELAIKVMLPVL